MVDYVVINSKPYVPSSGGASDMSKDVYDANFDNIVDRSSSADKLTTARTINGVSFDGSTNITIPISQQTFVHSQLSAASVWTITHNLGKYPTVSIVDSAGSVVVGDITYTSENEITLTFTGAFSGNAYLN